MKKYRFFKSDAGLICALTMFLSLLTTGCGSSSDSLLDRVPADAEFISVVDVDGIVKNAGFKIENGVIIPSEDFQKILKKFNDSDMSTFNDFCQAAPALDLTQVVMFTNGKYAGAALRLKQPDKMENILAQKAVSTDNAEGYNLYVMDNDFVVAVKGEYAEIYRSSKVFNDVRKKIKENGSFLKKEPYLADRITGKDKTVSGFVSYDKNISLEPYNGVAQEFDRIFYVFDLSLRDYSLNIKVEPMDNQGKNLHFSPYMEETGTDFLRFVNPASTGVLAVGKPRNLSSLITALQSNPYIKEYAQFLPFLESISGTTALSAVPVSDNPRTLLSNNLNAWNITLTTQLNGNDAQSLMQLAISQGARKLPETAVGGEVEQYVYNLNDTTNIYFGLFQGTLAISNNEISDTYSNSFAPEFQGVLGCFIISYAPGSPITKAFDCPFGVTLKVSAEDTGFNMDLRLNGTNKSFLASISEAVAK